MADRSPWWPHARFDRELPEDFLARWRRAVRLADRGDVEAAVERLTDLVAERPDFVPALSKLGALMAASGRVEEAQTWLDRALAADPNYPPALNNRGNLLLEAGDVDGAVELYRRALEVDDAYALARHNLAVALKRRGDIEGFVREFKRSQRSRIRQDEEEIRRRGRPGGCLPGTAAVALLALAVAAALWL